MEALKHVLLSAGVSRRSPAFACVCMSWPCLPVDLSISPSLECLTRPPADDSPQNGLVPRIAQMSSTNWRKSFVGSVEGRPLGSLRDVWFQGDCEIGTIATKARDSDHLGRVGGHLTWAEWGYRSLHLIGGGVQTPVS